ncbi:MAG: SdiA-regulated domain-containing protein [Cyclobacteriaceae bacterium]|nr:SdiA-regulated domain-containing protein [Cyclobacteriaceae bacterium HetDA_MAG_MS6]
MMLTIFTYLSKLSLAFVLFWPLLPTTGCSSPGFGTQADSLFLVLDNAETYYNLKKPDQKYFLPYVLSEISGLDYIGEDQVICVEDEGGKAYIYDFKARNIVHSIAFAKPGDYEGVEMIGDEVFVLESDGDVYRFTYTSEKKSKSKKYETDLTRENDTEGLGFDPVNNMLLIACKEEGEVDKNKVKGKAIYAFDQEDEKLKRKPRFNITNKDLVKFFESHKDRSYEAERLKFEPSGIAYHPIEKAFYLLASVGKLLVVLDQQGNIKTTYPISPRILNQPEGICFAPNGDMYISSEGEGDRGYIMKFVMRRK